MEFVAQEEPDEARTEAAKAWLLDRTSDVCGAEELGKLETMELTSGQVRAIECARAAVAAVETGRSAMDFRNACLQTAAQRAQRALGPAVGSTGGKPHALARTCATLGLGEDSASGVEQLLALTAVARRVLSSRAAAARARADHARAAAEVRQAARGYAEALRASEELRCGRAARLHEATKAWERVFVLDEKVAQYDVASGEAKGRVRRAGVDSGCTHEAVVARARKVRAARKALDHHTNAAERYMGLPPDLALAKEKVDETRRALAAAEQEIRNALDGFMDE